MLKIHDSNYASANSDEVSCDGVLPVSFAAEGLDAGTKYTMQIRVNGTWTNLYNDGSVVEVTNVNNAVTIFGPGVYRGVKSGAAAASLGASYKNNL